MRLLPLLLSLLAAAPASAQDATGYGILSEQGRPIVGAPVVVDGVRTLLTDQDGLFRAGFPPGRHTFRVALHGYRTQERTVDLTRERAQVVNFALEPLLHVVLSSVPATLARGAPAAVQVLVTNTAASAYAIEAAGVTLIAAGRDRSADFAVLPDPANPTILNPGETTALTFTLIPAATAPAGPVLLRASLFTFDTVFGENLIPNSSFERVSATGGAPPWFFAIDNPRFLPGAAGAIVTGTAMTGRRSGEVRVPAARPGDARAYWSNPVPIKPGATYVLSGYVKSGDVVPNALSGAAVYVPVTGNLPHQEPVAPWITDRQEWRKVTVLFRTTNQGARPIAHCRGQIQQSEGVAWFDNLAMTEGPVDASLTVTSPDQILEIIP